MKKRRQCLLFYFYACGDVTVTTTVFETVCPFTVISTFTLYVPAFTPCMLTVFVFALVRVSPSSGVPVKLHANVGVPVIPFTPTVKVVLVPSVRVVFPVIVTSYTLIVTEAVFDSSATAFAVKVTEPVPTNVTTPEFSSIVATPLLSELHLTLLFVVLSLMFTVADIVRFPFFSTSPLSCTPLITTPVTVGFALFTVTVHVAYFVPSATDVAVIVAFPSPTALTFPFSSTVATES